MGRRSTEGARTAYQTEQGELHIAQKLGNQELTLAQRIANEDLKGIRHNYGK